MSGQRRGPRAAEDRVRRLLVMLPWLMERGEVSVAETAERFDLTEAEKLDRTYLKTLFMPGN